ncbi:MAG TPA: tetratricopeptide repeat protein, partial [Verrucomicrobiae bacterium]|nr:tetratricopeptide repeat protein [Verrucomicrobiae bacterium]
MAILAFLNCASLPLRAAGEAENNAFGAAIKELKDGGRVGLALAESDFAEIAKKYPASERYTEAILYQAQARFELAKAHQGSWSYADVIELLTAQQSRMGKLADQYHYWIAEASFQSGNYTAAATAFDWVVTHYPDSTKLRECIYGAAEARAKQGDWAGVIDQLGRTNGAFQGLARANSTNDWVLRGNLLLSEAQYLQRDYPGAKNTLQILSQQKLYPELDWRRQYLLCEVQLGEGHREQALLSGTNLIELARNTGNKAFLSDSIAFQAGIFEELGQLDAAIDIYSNSLKELPIDRQRQAQLKIIELTLRQNRADIAAQKLEEFVARNTNGPNADLALLTLGELRLKAYFEGTENASAARGGTNLLNEALIQFNRMAANFTNSEFLGQAQLDRGWCFWTQGKMAESLSAFGAAYDRLPVSVEKAVACFKKADCLYAQKEFARAVASYNLVIDQYGSNAPVKSELFEPALYQIVRANLEQKNLPAAENAMRRILKEYPGGFLTDRSMLLVGQAFNRR